MKFDLKLFCSLAVLALLPVIASAVVPEGQPAPKVSMKLLKDGVISDFPGWNAYKGKVIVLEFWRTDCAPCVAEIPRMNELHRVLQGKPIEFISITTEKATQILKFIKKRPMAGQTAVDGDAAWRAFGVRSVPQTVLISSTGVILRYTASGELSGKALRLLADKGSVSSIAQICNTREEAPADSKENARAASLFEVHVDSVPNSGNMEFGRASSREAITAVLKGLDLGRLIAQAYDTSAIRVEVSSALPMQRFNFSVRVPRAAENMIQPLLQQAIKAAYGAEVRGKNKEKQVLVLVYDKQPDHEGLAPANGGFSSRTGQGSARLSGAKMFNLTELLENLLDMPVLDETGLTGRYDIDLEWKEGNNDALKTALKDKLGMALVSASREVEILEVVPSIASAN